jgi:hypothetical protein
MDKAGDPFNALGYTFTPPSGFGSSSSSEVELPMTAADKGFPDAYVKLSGATYGRASMFNPSIFCIHMDSRFIRWYSCAVQIAACVERWEIQLPESGAVSLREMHHLQSSSSQASKESSSQSDGGDTNLVRLSQPTYRAKWD